jgi:hypothetical protein
MRHIGALDKKDDLVRFDPVYHEDSDEAGFAMGDEVEIVKSPIVRNAVILLRGEVKRIAAGRSWKAGSSPPPTKGAFAQAEAVMNSTSTMATRR